MYEGSFLFHEHQYCGRCSSDFQKNGRYINKQFVSFNNKLYSCLREVPLLYILLMSVGSS